MCSKSVQTLMSQEGFWKTLRFNIETLWGFSKPSDTTAKPSAPRVFSKGFKKPSESTVLKPLECRMGQSGGNPNWSAKLLFPNPRSQGNNCGWDQMTTHNNAEVNSLSGKNWFWTWQRCHGHANWFELQNHKLCCQQMISFFLHLGLNIGNEQWAISN